MGYVQLAYTPEQVDLAGDALRGDGDAYEQLAAYDIDFIDVINNWRASHLYPLNSFQMTLRNRTRKVDPDGIATQRIKRLSSIEEKLSRYDWLKLSAMQDIAGCRVIANSVDQVSELVDSYKHKNSRHKLDDYTDYIRHPKSDGYRGYHLIYRYSSSLHPEYSDLKVEIQLRSSLQHCWATAVETADIFLREGLKQHRGSPEWRRFFALMGAAIAMHERCHRVPKTPKDPGGLVKELRGLAQQLDVETRLRAFGQAVTVSGSAEARGIKYVVLALDPEKKTTQLFGYPAGYLEDATTRYEMLERHRESGVDAVLVSVSDTKRLRRAYPNYFLDTDIFLDMVRETIA
jgi:hypothetical protein